MWPVSVLSVPDEMSTRIGVASDKAWKKGDTRGKSEKIFDTNSWRLQSRSEVRENPLAICETVNSCLNDIFGRVTIAQIAFEPWLLGRNRGFILEFQRMRLLPWILRQRQLKQ
jgi:hypothetical protein